MYYFMYYFMYYLSNTIFIIKKIMSPNRKLKISILHVSLKFICKLVFNARKFYNLLNKNI